jgi:hypothetical protein
MAETKIMAPDINHASENSPKIKYIMAAAINKINIGSVTASFKECQNGLLDLASILLLPKFFRDSFTSSTVSPGKEKGLSFVILLIH